MVNLVGLEIN